MRDAPNVGLRRQTTRSSETTKDVSSFKQSDVDRGRHKTRAATSIIIYLYLGFGREIRFSLLNPGSQYFNLTGKY